ncbi:YcfA family protein [Syntrophobotulus glycolicus DSM 8271]|uniref:YcfA family protein n=1 Tax=Syntrophobotulus glycolicus (strain DSM 8271 / FlGlyR) TaxID=645991 RepID=F0T0F6_SYNGF|nr:type II toxin-antitoxin system HicA family toxin [Syntrophobotulus glycolicus]ADY57328.1 YcfA family protein [Syntrophobotulus glycolicus DSM 8271]
MTEKEILRLLKNNGWKITEGTRHHLAINPNHPGVRIPIPRHKKDIPPGTLHQILRAAGLK